LFLPTDIATGGGITDERDADRRFPSVSPSVNNLTTNTESHTDGFNPSVKLLNLVVTIEVGCMIFGMKAKKNTRDNDLQSWNDVAVWRDFKLLYIPGYIQPQYVEHETSERFTQCSQSSASNRNKQIHVSVTTHTGGSVPFAAYA